MAKDIKVIYNNNPDKLTFDIEYINSDLTREKTIETAVYMSLYTDRRAGDSDNLKNDNEKKKVKRCLCFKRFSNFFNYFFKCFSTF